MITFVKISKTIGLSLGMTIGLSACGLHGDMNTPEAEWVKQVVSKHCSGGRFIADKKADAEIIKVLTIYPLNASPKDELRWATIQQNGAKYHMTLNTQTLEVACSNTEWSKYVNKNKLRQNPVLPKTDIPFPR